jgi:DNA-binding response OmpR family regulator
MATILIVEDDRWIRQILEVTLSSEDHLVLQTSSAAQAIEVAHLIRLDLILLDLNLQGHRDGLEVCRALRSEPDPALARIPIVMLTGQTTNEDIRAALKAGADSYMGKPYKPTSLLAVVNALLGKKGA